MNSSDFSCLQVCLSFLMVGHTHEDVDQVFQDLKFEFLFTHIADALHEFTELHGILTKADYIDKQGCFL